MIVAAKLPNANPVASANRPGSESANSPNGAAPSAPTFATLLHQNQPAAREAAQAAPHATEHTAEKAPEHAKDSTDETASKPANQAATGEATDPSGAEVAPGAPKTKARGSDKAAKLPSTRHADAEADGDANAVDDRATAGAATTAEAASTSDARARAEDNTKNVDPALAQWLASLNLRREPVPTAVAAAAASGTADADQADARQHATRLGADLQGSLASAAEANEKAEVGASRKSLDGLKATRDAADQQSTTATAARAELGANAKASSFAAALAAEANGTAATSDRLNAGTRSTSLDPTAASLPAGAAFQPAAGLVQNDPTPLAVPLPVPVAAPEFAQALGVQLSLLAKDGVQHAELHLNPAEMGPVSVHIAMDGTQARVEFGADLAATRQAIEAGMPELAGALRDAGFTLAGGGVSQHARGQGDGGQAKPGSDSSRRGGPVGSAGDGADGGVATTARRTVRAGGLDLYA